MDVVAGRRLRLFSGAVAALAVALVLAGCGESHSDLVRRQHVQIVETVRNLGAALDGGRIRNANIVKQYARIVRRDRPDVAALADELSKEATTRGLAYASLAGRLDRINLSPADQKEADESMEELLRIEAASDAVVFNDSLIDVVNVLADLSDGKLSRLQIPRSEPRPDAGPGSHLVGNPRYGEWRQGSGGSFWQFYGQYALMRDLFFGPSTYYHRDWYPNRGWSYYGDVGRHYYGTRADSRRWDRASRTQPSSPKKSYGPLRSERRLSTYGRSASRSAGAATRRASTYSRNYGSSARGTSRASGFRGK